MDFFAVFRVTFLMSQVCFKLITCYIEMHHVRTFFLCDVMTFLYYVMFIHNMFIFKREAYWSFCFNKKHSEFVLIISYLQLINSGRADSSMADKNHSKLSS